MFLRGQQLGHGDNTEEPSGRVHQINGARIVEGLAGKPGENVSDSFFRMGRRDPFGEMVACGLGVVIIAAMVMI
jgi:hypothetical protein